MTLSPDATAVTHVEVRHGAYADSVALLQVSKDIAALPGVVAAQVAMATPLNVDLLVTMGFTIPESTPNDMIVAVTVTSTDELDAAIRAIDDALAATGRSPSTTAEEHAAPRTTASALRSEHRSLVLISVPGPFAAVEAMDALDLGSDVMIFSDNVPVDQEVALKTIAGERGLIVMGPDCGTALIGGVGLGFSNAVQPGPVGLVAASGTGAQQLMALLDHAHVGISAAIGVGGRDLSAHVGGLSTRAAMSRLDADPSTELIVVVSKPPATDVADSLRAFASTLSTPVELVLLGAGQPDLTLAAEHIVERLGRPATTWPTWGTSAPVTSGGLLRGLFVGGTLCDEAMLIASHTLGPIRSNIPLAPELLLDASLTAATHLMIDFGDDSLTQGRAHPMIDPTLRLAHLAGTSVDSATSVILMDVVLGHGSESDPAASLAPAITHAIDVARRAGRDLAVVVACVGTRADQQQIERQANQLATAGAHVFLSNAQATRRAVELIGATR